MEDLMELARSQPLISDAHDKCFKSFKGLVAAIQHPVRDLSGQISPSDVRNEFDRYKVWAGNVGAMHRGRRHQISLDYRLSEASFYKQQTRKQNVWVYRDPTDTFNRFKGPAEEEVFAVLKYDQGLEGSPRNDSDLSSEGSPWEISDSEDLDDDIALQEIQKSPQATAPRARKPTMEIPYKLAEIDFTITCLYKLPLRRPAPLERFRGQTVADMSIYQHFDILYVKDKFPLANSALVMRLGKLVTRRRQLLASRSAHDKRLLSEDVETEEDASEANQKPGKSEVPRNDHVKTPVKAANEGTLHGQLSSSRPTRITKASILCEELKLEDEQKISSLENFSEYVPSMASSYATKLRVDVPDRPRDINGEELQDFKCPYCFIVSREKVEIAGRCELYELMFEKRDDWYQHEMQSHRIEWRCGQTGHPAHADQATFLAHMSDHHNVAVDAAQSPVFLSMFEQQRRSQEGTCCLCFREAENLKTHLAHHLEQIALFALPRENEVPEMDSGINMRGTAKAVSKKASLDSRSGPPNQQDRASLQGSGGIGYQGEEDNDEKIDTVDQILVPESDPDDTGFSWNEVYQKIGPSDVGINKDSQKRRIRKWLNAPEQFQIYNAILKKRLTKSGNWFLDSLDFAKWKTTSGSFIWLYGTPGCGKSMLSSLVIETVLDYCASDPSIVVLRFYFSFTDLRPQRCEEMLRSLIDQLFSQHASTPQVLESHYSSCIISGFPPACDLLVTALHQMMNGFKEIYLIVDALDECLGREELLAYIKEFTSWRDINLHILTTSRREWDIEESLKSFDNDQGVVCIQFNTSFAIKDDIRAYVHERLRTDRKLNKWQKVHPLIEDELTDQANGMFLWVVCQLDSLRSCVSVDQVMKRLASLPRSLDETYTQVLCNIREEDFMYAFKILQWLACTARPLKFREVVKVVAIDVRRSPRLNSEGWLKEPQDLLEMCSGLISFSADEEMSANAQEKSDSIIVQLAHGSVKEYLVSERILRGRAKRYGFREVKANTTIYEDCLAYLLELCERSSLDFHPNTLGEFPLAEYAATYWTQHAQVVERDTSLDPILTVQFLMKGNGLLNWIRLYDPDKPWEGADFERNSNSICPPLYYASMAGLAKSVRLLLDKGANVNAQGGMFYRSALQAAAQNGHYQVVQLLLDKGANALDENALEEAARNGHYQVVQLLLDKGAPGEYALREAARNGHYQVVQLLLDKGAKVYGQGQNALQEAARHGHRQVVQLLLDKGPEVNARDEFALREAARNGHYQVVVLLLDKGAKLLLDKGAKFYARGENALREAARNGHYQVVQLLLDKGAPGEYALEEAARNGHYQVVQLLIDKGAKVYGQGENALQEAARNGHYQVVQLLLDNGADVNAQGGLYGGALQAAARHNNCQVVQLLLDRGANVNAQGGYYGNALQAASQEGYYEVVQMLLDKGADVNARGVGKSRGALQEAEERGHHRVVQLLLDRGAH
ncbi:MAG: hypothetical protein Q9214_001499 [Letrouitia sp. 1 TL-2023]